MNNIIENIIEQYEFQFNVNIDTSFGMLLIF